MKNEVYELVLPTEEDFEPLTPEELEEYAWDEEYRITGENQYFAPASEDFEPIVEDEEELNEFLRQLVREAIFGDGTSPVSLEEFEQIISEEDIPVPF